MRCPFLKKIDGSEETRECGARGFVFEPSSSELAEYCTTPMHRGCPLFRDRITPILFPTRIKPAAKWAVG